MNGALRLAALVCEIAPWTDGLYAFPARIIYEAHIDGVVVKGNEHEHECTSGARARSIPAPVR
jgi:hypothetical protein